MIGNLLHRWKEDRLFLRMLCLALASILCAVDHLNHADAVEPNDRERKMPTSLELMQLENEDELINSRYSILVNEFLFQFGI